MEQSQFIHTGWLIDGSGGCPQKNMLLHIKNGFIHAIKPMEEMNNVNTVDIMDLSHCTILPGIIDSHVHLFMSGTNDTSVRIHQLDADYADIKGVISDHIRQFLRYGVIAVRDGGDKHGHALRNKMEYPDNNRSPLIIKVAGKAWHKPGRYGMLIGRTPVGNDSLAESLAKENEKIDHIKIVNSGLNSLKHFGKETSPQFSLEELSEAVRLAVRRGLKVMVHANGKVPVKIAIEAGCHSIEHGFFMGKDNLKLMADNQITWVPTACTMKAYSECLKQGSVEADISRRNLEQQLEQMFHARTLGVPLALGTDAGSLGVFHGAAILEELKLLLESGFSIQEAIQCATETGAKLLGIMDETGPLVKGKPATFIAVTGELSTFPQHLSRLNNFYIKGCPYPNLID